MDGQGGTHGGQGAARRVGRAVRASGEDVGVGLASRVHAPGDGRGNGKCDIYIMYMRENSRFEMMRAVGAKAVASVEMAVPPTMVAGELSVEISEGETSGEDFRDGDHSDIDD